MQQARYDWCILTLKDNKWSTNEVCKGNKAISNVGLRLVQIKIELKLRLRYLDIARKLATGSQSVLLTNSPSISDPTKRDNF